MRTKNQIFILCGIVVFCAVALLKFPSKDYIGYVFYSIYAQLQGIIQGSQLTVSLMEFHISKTWNGSEIDHTPVVISLSGAGDKGLQVNVKAPFFNSPPAPNSPAGQPCDRLWDYEVVEAFFLNDKGEYVEVELCPHGQHLVLLIKGMRNCIQDKLALDLVTSKLSDGTWKGTAYIPYSYFPPSVTKFNAYAIHGEGNNRTYEALYPSSGLAEPDFHRLEFFKEIDFQSLIPPSEINSIGKIWLL